MTAKYRDRKRKYISRYINLCRNSDFDFDTSLNVDDDLLHNLSRRIEINQTLVDPVQLGQYAVGSGPSIKSTHLIS
jgi:hypothetical protein